MKRFPIPLSILVGLVALAPLPIASVSSLSWSALAFGIGALVVISGIGILRGDRPPSYVWMLAAPFFLVTAWIVVQSTSLLSQFHHPIWTDAMSALHIDLAGSISLDTSAASGPLTRLLSYAGVLWLAIYYTRTRSSADLVIYVLVFSGGLYALYGLVEFSSGNRNILWYPKPAYPESLTSTFINRNSYATYCGLLLIGATGMVARFLLERRKLSVLDLMLLPAWGLLCIVLFLSGSRGGITCTLLGVAVVLATAGFLQIRKAPWQGMGFAVGIALALGIVYQQQGELFSRRLQDSVHDAASRGNVFRITTALIMETPLVGTGYGTFTDAFRMHRDETVIYTYDKAHNTYLEEALELGIPAAAALIGTAIAAVLICIAGLRRANPMMASIGIAAGALIGLHSLIDFSVQIPAVAVTFSLMLGAAMRQSHP